MAIYSFEISNSRDTRKNGVKAFEHHTYIERSGKYSPDFELEKESYSAESHLEYVQRQNAFSKKVEYEDLVCSQDKNMPSWAKENANLFWQSSEKYERANGRTYSEFLISLPHELDNDENKKLIDKFCEDTFGESFIYSYGIHSKPSSEENIQNIHAHIMFCERKLDGIERNPEQFFKRYNPKYPERGGAKKDRFWNDKRLFPIMRQSWEKHLNEILETKEIEKVSCKSLKAQKLEAKMAGDILKEEFFNRPPVNCSGKILMKLEKYGIDKLTKKEKDEYNLYVIAKELKEVHLKEYIEKRKEKENKLENISLEIKDIIFDRSKFSVYESKKNLEDINEFNSYELQKYKANSFLLGMDILAKEDSIGIKKQVELEAILTYKFSENYSLKKEYQSDYSSLKHDNYNFETRDIEKIQISQLEFYKQINNLKEKKKEVIKNYKENFFNFDMQYSLQSLLNVKERTVSTKDLQILDTFIEKYDTYKKTIEPTEKKEIKEWIEEKYLVFAEHYTPLYKEFITEKFKLIEKDKNDNTKKEIFDKFNAEYKDIEINLEILNNAVSYTSNILKNLEVLKEKEREENEWLEREKDILTKKFTTRSSDTLYKEPTKENTNDKTYKENLNKYIDVAFNNYINQAKIKDYNSLLSNTERLNKIATGRNISVKQLILGYQNTIKKLESESEIHSNLEKTKYDYIISEKNKTKKEINQRVFKEISDEINTRKKSLYAKLDTIIDSKEKNNIFLSLNHLSIKDQILNSLFGDLKEEENKNKTKSYSSEKIKKENTNKNNVSKEKNSSKPFINSIKSNEDLNKAKGKKVKNSIIPKKNKNWEDYIEDNEIY